MCFSPLLRSAQWHLQLNRGKVNSHRNTRYIWRRSIFVAQESRVTYGADTMCWEVVNESHYSKRFVPRKQNTTKTDPIFQIKPHSGKNTANTVNQLKRSLNIFANDSYVFCTCIQRDTAIQQRTWMKWLFQAAISKRMASFAPRQSKSRSWAKLSSLF